MFRTFSAAPLVTHRGPDETECALNNAVLYIHSSDKASSRCLATECRRPPMRRELADEALAPSVERLRPFWKPEASVDPAAFSGTYLCRLTLIRLATDITNASLRCRTGTADHERNQA
jgi:hypothetical protein